MSISEYQRRYYNLINFFLNALRSIQTQLMEKLEQSGMETQLSPQKSNFDSHSKLFGFKIKRNSRKVGNPKTNGKRILSDLQSKEMIEKQGRGRSTVYLTKG